MPNSIFNFLPDIDLFCDSMNCPPTITGLVVSIYPDSKVGRLVPINRLNQESQDSKEKSFE